MAEYDEPPILMLRRHCAMYAYGSAASRSPMLDDISDAFFAFADMHLMCTMFITTDERGGAAGIFHRVLDPMGHSGLLDEVDAALDGPIGATTLRRYLRHKRNRLATHGTFEYNSQADDVAEVVFDDAALEQYFDAIESLDAAVRRLDSALAAIEAATGPCP